MLTFVQFVEIHGRVYGAGVFRPRQLEQNTPIWTGTEGLAKRV